MLWHIHDNKFVHIYDYNLYLNIRLSTSEYFTNNFQITSILLTIIMAHSNKPTRKIYFK